MITTAVDLMPFCSRDEQRPAISSPWFDPVRGCTYATDGRIIIELPGCHPQAVNNPDVKRPNVEAVLKQWRDWAMQPLPQLPEAKVEVCEECDGDGTVTCNCPDCPAMSHECPSCEGDGKYDVSQPVRIGAASFADTFLRLIAALPEPIFMPGPGELDPASFKFHGGRGLLMPRRE